MSAEQPQVVQRSDVWMTARIELQQPASGSNDFKLGFYESSPLEICQFYPLCFSCVFNSLPIPSCLVSSCRHQLDTLSGQSSVVCTSDTLWTSAKGANGSAGSGLWTVASIDLVRRAGADGDFKLCETVSSHSFLFPSFFSPFLVVAARCGLHSSPTYRSPFSSCRVEVDAKTGDPVTLCQNKALWKGETRNNEFILATVDLPSLGEDISYKVRLRGPLILD
ncbi:unnamed protein product [Dibothriocephalus latus]|uniref:Uncharacterized protein n=1 Tax=Dibothriocephalus latus TaxID=60516 RepID=A0A3P7NN86_DIBLA|nr:unnamed protein product [Dibothriocephalus latus]